MAFASTFTNKIHGLGHGLQIAWGTFTNAAGDTGGTIETGFASVLWVGVMPTSNLGTQYPKYTGTASDGSVTIVTEDAMDANWIAFGIGEG